MAVECQRDDGICGDDPHLYDDQNRQVWPPPKWGLAHREASRAIVIALAGLFPGPEDDALFGRTLAAQDVTNAIRERSARRVILDLRRLAMFSTSHRDWIQDTFVPAVGSCGVQRAAVILPANVYALLVAGMPTAQGYWANVHGAQLPVPINYFEAESAAVAWLEAD